MSLENRYSKAIDKICLDKEAENRLLRNCLERRDRTPPITRRTVKICAAFAVIAVLLGIIPVIPAFFNADGASPLVISVYAEDENGICSFTEMKANKQVKLVPDSVTYGSTDFIGYSFNLKMHYGTYVCVAVIDEYGNVPPTNEQSVGRYGEKGRWAMTKGDDILRVISKDNGEVLDGYKSGKFPPMPHGSAMIWKPNDEGNCFVRIRCYDENFKLISTRVLRMVEQSDGYYADIIIVD